MSGDISVDWAKCSQDECQGIRLHTGGKCLAHADNQDLDGELKRVAEEGTIDARGVTISAALLYRILDAAPHDAQTNRRRLNEVTFDGAHFEDRTLFYNVTFGEDARFIGATFGDSTEFRDAAFVGATSFAGATFGDGVWFTGANFSYGTEFDVATFGHHARFTATTFGNDASFESATFGHHARFGRVRFDGSVSFDDANIGDWARFGPIVAKQLMLRRATFGRSPDLVISADRIRCTQGKFSDGARLRVRWAEVTLDNTDFGRPSVLEAAPALKEFTEIGEPELIQDALTGRHTHRTAYPRPICLAGCDVHNLLLVDCDLRACRFAGAHNLAGLRLEGAIMCPSTPQGWQAAWTLPPLWRWGRRQTIAEEHYWRQLQPKRNGWRGAPSPSPSPYVAEWHDHGERGDPSNPHGPPEIASVYRALRKGREDNKDEPGAADFYYGEMEMRRHDRANPRAERLVLRLYWLTSGYALRASRALAWLLGILVLATVLLAAVGLEQPATISTVQATITGSPPHQTIRFQTPTAAPTRPPLPARLGTAALVAVEGAVFRTSEQQLTYLGRLIQAVLRFAGPILLGLAVFSIRGRVKR
jgi:uncharacterized protein YjbI with pentapeptide repeats